MKLVETYKLIDNTIENFNEQIRIFKELLKKKKIKKKNSSIDVDMLWFSDTSIYLKNKQILLKIMNLEEGGIKTLDEELWDDLNYKINLVVSYIIEYPNLFKLLIYNVRSQDYIMNSICSENFFPMNSKVSRFGLGLNQKFKELPIQPHELLKSLSTEINNNSVKLIKSLYAIFYESLRYIDITERDVYVNWMTKNHTQTSVIDIEGGIFQLIKLYILYFTRTELKEILDWYNSNSEVLLPYFTEYENFLITNDFIVEDEE